MSPLVVAACLLAIERLVYGWVFHWPETFARGVARWRVTARLGPPRALSGLFVMFKLVQIGVFAWWCWHFGAGTWLAPVDSDLRRAAMALGITLVVVGQALNVRVFALLGTDGVFYGNRFGLPVPWRQAFPFSVVAHPQYVGTCLSIWGAFLVARCPHDDWYVLPVVETVYYVAGALVEN